VNKKKNMTKYYLIAIPIHQPLNVWFFKYSKDAKYRNTERN